MSDHVKLSGAIPFSTPALVKFIKKENLLAYWAGPDSADKYTVLATNPGEVVVTYFPNGADIRKMFQALEVF